MLVDRVDEGQVRRGRLGLMMGNIKRAALGDAALPFWTVIRLTLILKSASDCRWQGHSSVVDENGCRTTDAGVARVNWAEAGEWQAGKGSGGLEQMMDRRRVPKCQRLAVIEGQ